MDEEEALPQTKQQSLQDRHSLRVLEAIANSREVNDHHISSMNHEIRQNLRNLNYVVIDPCELSDGHVLHFRLGDVAFQKPTMTRDDRCTVPLTPKMSRNLSESYAANMYVDMHVFTARSKDISLLPHTVQMGYMRRRARPLMVEEDEDGDDVAEDDDCTVELELAPGVLHRVYPRVLWTRFPAMVGSMLCHLEGLPVERLIEMGEFIHEPGGVFLMNGKERVIVPQKNMAQNMLYISKDVPTGQQVMHIDENCSNQIGNAIFSGTIHCCAEAPDAQRVVNKIIIAYDKEYQDIVIRVSVTQIYAGKGIPIAVLLAALGMSDWQTVLHTIAAAARLDVAVVAKLLHASSLQARECYADSAAASAVLGASVHRAAWQWLSEKSSTNMRMRTHDALPQHPDDPRKTAAYNVIHCWFLPHVLDGMPQMQEADDFWAACRVKAYTLCHYTASVLRVCVGLDKCTDRDHLETKRWEAPGTLILNLFRMHIRQQVAEMRSQITNMDRNKKPIDIVSAMSSDSIQKRMAVGLQTGKFTISKRSGGQSQQSAAAGASTGVSQASSRLNQGSYVSHQRKIAAAGNRKTPANARQLHTSQYGFVCPYETPEGQPCGIVNHMAMLCYITLSYPSSIVIDWLASNVPGAAAVFEPEFDPSAWRIVVNNRLAFSFAGDADVANAWMDRFKDARFSGEMPRDISISCPRVEMREVKIYCDGGRLTRPLCVVHHGNQLQITADDIRHIEFTAAGGVAEDGRLPLTLDEMFRLGKVELIDAAETEDTYIATFYSEVPAGEDYTHCEVCPVTMTGISAGLIPFADRNQSPRNVYQSCMSKQAFGTPSIPLHGTMRATDHVLEHPEHPLVDTVLQSMKSLPFEWMPCGQNCIVFVDAYAHNVEDSLVVNQDSLESGLLSSYTDRTYMQTARRNTHHTTMECEVFEKPDPEHTQGYKTDARYDKIGADGLPTPGEMLTEHSVIIGKTGPLETPPQDPSARNRSVDRAQMFTDPSHTRKDLSLLPRKKGGGMVMDVTVTCTRETKRAAVTIRHHRKPQIGDKLCLSGDHDVLTTTGWKPIADVAVGDEIATMHPETFELSYEAVTKSYAFDHTGAMYAIRSQQVDLFVTMEHRMLVQRRDHKEFELLQAKDITGKRVRYKKDARNTQPDYEVQELDVMTVLKDEQIPEWVWSASQQQSCALLTGILALSSHKVECAGFADEIQRLALHAGVAINISTDAAAVYKLCVVRDYDEDVLECEQIIADFDGKVYCVEVPNHVFYVRRNGKAVWTGNSSRHGQKGIVAKKCRGDELPCTLDGVRPDIVMNPHAYPSRMTAGQTTEAALGKVGASKGVCQDGTIFFGPSKDDISEQLYMLKLDPDSEQRVIHPKTGEVMESALYTGVVYYQVLKHLVEEKVHARNRGPVTKLNKQPVEGRRRDGGLRIGEMEKESMIAHGAAQLGVERTCDVSDAFQIPVCSTCGRIFAAHREKTQHVSYYCPVCDSRDNITVETIPWVLKQFFVYMLPMGIDTTLIYGNGHDRGAQEEADIFAEVGDEDEEEDADDE